MSITAKLGNMPHPAIILDDCPQLHSVIAELEAGTYPQPDEAVWREDLPRELTVRLARATGATDEQIAGALAEDGNAEAAEPLHSCTVCGGSIFEGERVRDYAGCTAHYGCVRETPAGLEAVKPEPAPEPEQEPEPAASPQKWANVDAGPQQIRNLKKAMGALLTEGKSFDELTGVIGGEERRWTMSAPFSPVRPEVVALHEAIKARHGHKVTRATVRAIIADYEAALPEAVKSRPTDDKRSTPEQEAERVAAEQAAERAAAEEAERAEPAEGCTRLTITHTHADGTLVHGTSKGDGVYELIGPRTAARFRYFPSIRMIGIPQSRDHLAKRWQIDQAAKVLRAAGHVVTVEIDDTPRDVGDVKADRAGRLDDRYDRLATKAERTAAESAARHAEADRISQRFAGGQPILVGHHSERSARRDHARMEANDRAAGELHRKAERAAAAASVVGSADAYRERPSVIRRRIDRLNAELRQTDHYIDGTRPANDWRGAYGYDRKPATGDYLEQLTARKTYLEHQIAGDEAALEALKADGYVMLTREDLHKGDRVHWGATWGDGMQGAIVTRVNPKTVTLDRTRWPRTLGYEQIKRVECPHEGTETTVGAHSYRTAGHPKREPVTVTAERPAEREAPIVVGAGSQFFPTPAAVVERMLNAARLEPGMTVLEPSAGLGAIARPAAARGASVDCIELNGELVRRLHEAGFNVQGADFLEVPARPEYDRVMMNPPFASRADVRHVRHVLHALGFLKPGGLLVAIMSAGAGFRDDNLTVGFRDTVEERGGTITALPDDAFKESGTGVRTLLVTIPAPAPAVTLQPEPEPAAELAGTLF